MSLVLLSHPTFIISVLVLAIVFWLIMAKPAA